VPTWGDAWAQVEAANKSGDIATAVTKGKALQAKVSDAMVTLGMKKA
jgi:hypothetical protein